MKKRIQPLIGIKLAVWDEAAGIVESGLQEHLQLASAGALHPGPKQHVGLPDLIGELGFVLFVGVGGALVEQQLAFGETAGTQEPIECRGRYFGLNPVGLNRVEGESQLTQQGGAGARGIFAFEPFDQGGGFGREGAHFTTILAWLGSERGKSVAAISHRPVQQSVHRNLPSCGLGNVVET